MTKIICDVCQVEIDEDNYWDESKNWRANVGPLAFAVEIQTTRLSAAVDDTDVHVCRSCMAKLIESIHWDCPPNFA